MMISQPEQLLMEKNAELQKELAAKKRELRIEASLQKIWETTMAMQHSEEMKEVGLILLEQMHLNGVNFPVCLIVIMNESDLSMEINVANSLDQRNTFYKCSINDHSVNRKMYDNWKTKSQSFIIKLEREELTSYRRYLRETGFHMNTGNWSGRRAYNMANFSKGVIGVISDDPLPPETMHVLERYAKVFDGTYTRFLDLEKAEAQAREAMMAKARIEKTLVDLKLAQAQLIQSEKMASLGELTAGIAHEIQNPLNFVNNFSDVNAELLEELKAERLKPKAERDEQLEDAILKDIKENEQKINHHGKRADAIVKGMLQHSRKSTGQKEPTDINVLADEYLRLSYHGLRAKDKTFNATMTTDFDESIGKINVISQDIGRVILNLFNNAFYAVSEKQKAKGLTQNDESEKYEPSISVITKKLDGHISIYIKDNGIGIPKEIAGKIFQPFFTTKPAGQGTGLGLSLSYDIIKAHGGELKVESKEGEFTRFIIQLPA
jgi:signal transduction histidine kinase